MAGSTQEMFLAALEGLVKKDVEPWVEMWAEDGSIEFPYAPPGYPERIDGKAAIREYMRAFPNNLSIERFHPPVFHPTLNPSVMLVEFSCEGHAVATGRPYNQRYVGVITTRDGRIVNYKDYWNPLVAQQALAPAEARS